MHIYWRNNDERNEAIHIQKVSIENNVQYFAFIEKAFGPQPFSMFEASVSSQNLPANERLLNDNQENGSILIYEKTSLHIYYRTKGARFLGELLELNIESLKNL